MTQGSDEPLPVLTVSLFDRAEIEGLVMSALDGSMALVPVTELLDEGGSYVLELCSPDRARPVRLVGVLAGDPSGGMCPMFLKPIDAHNADELLEFLGGASMPPAQLDEAASRDARAQAAVLTPRLSARPPASEWPPASASSRQLLDRVSIELDRVSIELDRSSMELDRPAVELPPPSASAGSDGEARGSITLQSLVTEHAADPSPLIEVVTPSALPLPPAAEQRASTPLPADGPAAVTLDNHARAAESSSRPSITNDPLLGRSLGGKYTILALIGAGGAGSVYRARHVMLQKDIAIKVMHPSLRKDPTFAERFHSEALAASKLDHPNVLRVLDFGEEPDGLLYIAMELLVGTELREILWQGRMPIARTLDIASQICAALSAASEVGIVHRDIKPENVVITSSRDDEGQIVDLVKVCDFGLATIAKADAAGSGEHRAAAYIAGTPEYMSPEQVRGEELDGRSDIYAVGILLYELVTGRVPFEGQTPVDILKGHLQKSVTPPSKLAKEIDPELEAIVLRALAKDRNQRPATAREVRAELRNLLERMRRPPPGPQAPEPSASPLDDPSCGFGELFVALTAAVARTTYYEREHPEFARSLVRLVHAVRAPLAGRGELTIAQRDVRDAELVVQTGAGEVMDLRRVLPAGVHEAYGPRLGEVFQRRHVVSLTLKEGVPEADLADATELLSGPDIAVDALRLDFLSRGLTGVSILFSEELLGKGRKLPWHVDLCISRLARDLRALPLLRGVTEDAMRTLRVQLVADVVRSLERPDDIRLLLENTDLVATSVQHIPELGALDFRSVIVSALRRPLAVASAKHLLGLAARPTPPPATVEAPGRIPTPPPAAPDVPFGRGLTPPPAGRAQASSARLLLAPFASRFLRDRSPETDAILRSMLDVRVVDLTDLPPELQLAVAADRLAAALAADPELVFRKLAAASDLAGYEGEIRALTRALAVLATAGDARTVATLVARLSGIAKGASPGEPTREGMAAGAVASLASDAAALAALADALLFGPVPQREPARAVLAQLGHAAARALLAARARGTVEAGFPRPRLVAALREVGRAALPALAEHLSRIDPEGEGGGDEAAALAEDLLRALPDAADEPLGRVVARFLRHRTPAVRRAAASGLPSLLGARAKLPLLHALDDIDEGVCAAAFAGLRSIRCVDDDVVVHVDRVLVGGAVTSDELRAGAAGALAEVRDSARARAVEVLTRALRPRPRSMLSLFKNADDTESVLVLTTVARVLLAIGGEAGRKEVERRAGQSRGDLKKALTDLLQRPRG